MKDFEKIFFKKLRVCKALCLRAFIKFLCENYVTVSLTWSPEDVIMYTLAIALGLLLERRIIK